MSQRNTAQPSRYLDTFVRTKVGARLADLRIFPNAKEVTESYAARAAALRFRDEFPPNDPDVVFVSVGDGSTPRTAATFALHTAWQCHSVDPALRPQRGGAHRWAEVPRLTVHAARIEDCRFAAERVVVAAVHSHAPLSVSLASVVADHVLLIAIPCCVPVDLRTRPDVTYVDEDLLSPHRTIHVWHLWERDAGRTC